MKFKPKADDRVAADRLQTALEHHDSVSMAETEELAQTARLLEAAPLLGESQRAAMRSRMMRAAERGDSTSRDDAGSHDGEFSNPEIHHATVALPEGYAVLADVDPIDSERATRAVQEVIAAQAARDRQA